jgi:hypothetical protein
MSPQSGSGNDHPHHNPWPPVNQDQPPQQYNPWRPSYRGRDLASNRSQPNSPISPRSQLYPRLGTLRLSTRTASRRTNNPFADFDGTYVNARGEFGNRTSSDPDIRSPRPQASRRPTFDLNGDDDAFGMSSRMSSSTLGGGQGNAERGSDSDEGESPNAPPPSSSASDAYQVLGLTMDSTQKEIKKAHNKLAKTYHPDKNKSPNAKEIFQRLQDAWETLRTKESRDAYDAAQTIAAGFGCASPKVKPRKVVTKRNFPICGVCSRHNCNAYHRWFTREGYVQQMSLTMSLEYAESTASIDYEPQLKDALGRNLCTGCSKAVCDEPHRLFTKEGYLCYLLSTPDNRYADGSQDVQTKLDEAFPSQGQLQGSGGLRGGIASPRGGRIQFDGPADLDDEISISSRRRDGYQPLDAQRSRSFSFREFLRRGSGYSDRPSTAGGQKRTGSFSSLFKSSDNGNSQR